MQANFYYAVQYCMLTAPVSKLWRYHEFTVYRVFLLHLSLDQGAQMEIHHSSADPSLSQSSD